MTSVVQPNARTSQRRHHLHLHRPHLRRRKASEPTVANVPRPLPNADEGSSVDQELRQHQIIEQYVLSKLEAYANKSRFWQLTHSPRIKQRLLDKSEHIARLYSLPNDFVHDSINQLFSKVDKHVIQMRRLLHLGVQASLNADALLDSAKNSSNQWQELQLRRAREILPDLDAEPFTDDELLQKYYRHVAETLTPKRDTASSNSVAQLREQPFNLNRAYEQAEQKGKECLADMLHNYRGQAQPNLALIEEMVNLGLQHMKNKPSNEDFESATSFLSKISVLSQTKQAYESGLQNMGDDFMLLRFGKVFGSQALPTTARSNHQFIYLVHLLMKSISYLVMMLQVKLDDTIDRSSMISAIINSVSSIESNSSIVKVADTRLFSPMMNIDQWTWLLEKWRDALCTFPMLLTEVGAFSRLLRTTIGIGIARLYKFAETMIESNQPLDVSFMNEQLFHALQTGFYFGVAYAVVDCLQDEIQTLEKIPAHHLAMFDKQKGSDGQPLTVTQLADRWLSVMEGLLSGEEFDRKNLPKTPLTPLLVETFDSLITLTKSTDMTCAAFNELALLLRSQRADKKTPEQCYDDEELYLGALLKSHFTYTCTTYLGNIQSAREESERLWIMPFLGQMTDDCRDFYDDVTSDSVTSFTHYAAFVGRQQPSSHRLVNPFYVFLHLCSDIYLSSNRDVQTGAFVGRRIARTLRSIEIGSGQSALREFLHIFCQNNLPLHDYCWSTMRTHFSRVSDPEKSFFRYVNKASVQYARTNRKLETYVGDHLPQIEDSLLIHAPNRNSQSNVPSDRGEELLLAAMNYSVKAGGKRLRPLLMMMASDLFKLDLNRILPLVCGIEYLHTSSLILDDLPAQDNSDLRRGRPTLHKATINGDIPENLCEGRAQLAAVDLIAVSMSLINHDLVKNGFPPERVNQLVSEISLSMHDLCIGQMMDLRAAHMGMEQGDGRLDELDRIAWYKTGKAIEIVLIAPAVLALPSVNSDSIELARLRELGRCMGILFQMRDDLLDVEGENIGKPAALDLKNNTVTYVSVLGVEGTRQRLKDMRRQTLQVVNECWPSGGRTIKDVINYIVDRKN